MQCRRGLRILLVSVNAIPIACAHGPLPQQQPVPVAPQSASEAVFTMVSDALVIDTTYHSMEGPYQQVRFTIAGDRSDTLWITAMSADVVAPDLSPLPVEFFCHANLDYDADHHRRLFKTDRSTSNRLFTLSQGHEVMRFPDGFGIPVRSDEPLTLVTQVLSNNGVDAAKQVRVRVRVHYVRKGARPMKSLSMTAAIGAVSTDGQNSHYGMHGEHNMGSSTAGVSKTQHEYHDAAGHKFSGHWIVPPGKHSVRTVVTKWMNLAADTRVHYIGVHVHPFAQRITLRDVTMGEDVFTSRVTPLEGRIGISKVTDLSSTDGVRLYAKHHYELIADYENPTTGPVDAMAVLFLYVRDPQHSALESYKSGGQ
jgi:hypothetical protein